MSINRSKNMSLIKSKDTSIEVIFRKALWKAGFRYRKNYKKLPGKPDIVLTKQKIAIFCDGELWHGKNWDEDKGRIKSNRDYWIPKIEKNIKRDFETDRDLKLMGWEVLRFWGMDIEKNLASCIEQVREAVFYREIGVEP
jgi:DNA mismatch endonuclease (patch repair protein)